MPVHAHCNLFIVDNQKDIEVAQSPKGKPFMRLVMPDGTSIDLSLTLAEMIGAAAQGARRRFEDPVKGSKH